MNRPIARRADVQAIHPPAIAGALVIRIIDSADEQGCRP